MVKYNKTANASERLSFMVTEKEMAERNFSVSGGERKASYHVTADEMKRFAVNADLNNKVYKKIDDYTKKHNILTRKTLIITRGVSKTYRDIRKKNNHYCCKSSKK